MKVLRAFLFYYDPSWHKCFPAAHLLFIHFSPCNLMSRQKYCQIRLSFVTQAIDFLMRIIVDIIWGNVGCKFVSQDICLRSRCAKENSEMEMVNMQQKTI